MQFKAGYIVDSIAKLITDFKASLNKRTPADKNKLDQIDGLLQYVSSFDVEFPYEHCPDYRDLNPVLATLNNIITRGLPTKAPLILEELFSEIGLSDPNKDEFELNFPDLKKAPTYEDVFELLHIIEPELEINLDNYGGKPGSKLEWEFIEKHSFLKQILETQRDFSTINNKLNGGRTVDFCYSSPYLHWNNHNNRYERKGRIFEVDGPHHRLSKYMFYDAYRDAKALEENFETIRIPSEVVENDNTNLESLLGIKEYLYFAKNYKRDIKHFLSEYSLIFIPLAVARVQKTILEYLLCNPDLFNKEKIDIAVIERDLPCGAIAVKSLKDLFLNINGLLEGADKLKLPAIKLTVFETKKWVLDERLHLGANIQDRRFFKPNEFDILIDHSILRRSNIYKESDFQSDKAIKIRSSHYFDSSFGKSRRVYCARLLDYSSLVTKKDDGSYIPIKKLEGYINFFIQNIFRKVKFRDGQLPIISRALQQKPVIGLLPTGGGKSLAFQLPAFLQPGLCLVVDPIKSLMEDQVRVLRQNWIDSCDFINSNLRWDEKAKKLINFRLGETMFLFVSPERFVMEDFRNIIYNIDGSIFGLAFTYCVIDEVHCVSEWGHDFRTTYLMLGKNAQRFCKTRDEKIVSLLGLTATASFDVLTDIERELQIATGDSSDAIISVDNTIRAELFFNVERQLKKPTNYPIISQSIKDFIGAEKQKLLNKFYGEILQNLNSIDDKVILEGLKQHFRDFEISDYLDEDEVESQKKTFFKRITKEYSFVTKNDVVSIVFCPHTTGSFGVTQDANLFPNNKEVFGNLTIPHHNKGYFIGGDENKLQAVLQQAHDYFLDYMENRIQTMVCTKAFGMGIDKENIRVINHFVFSSSPESYIQEAGRAGRDQAKAICTIYLDSTNYYTVNQSFILTNNPDYFPTKAIRKSARDIVEYYNPGQNRIQQKYFEDKNTLKNYFGGLGISIKESDIKEFNQDLDIHNYFHTNSFKGIETELFQLSRFFKNSVGINTSQLKVCERNYCNDFDDEISFNLTIIGNYAGNMLVNNSEGEVIGKIFTDRNNPTATIGGMPANQKPDLQRTNQILAYLTEEWKTVAPAEISLFDFLKISIVKGLNDGLSLVDFFKKADEDEFLFEIPVFFVPNNLEGILETDFNLARLPIIHNTKNTADFLEALKKFSCSFEDFILRIEEQWNVNIINTNIFQTKRLDYKELYYSEIFKSDISRIIYRLNSVGLVDDYTIDYNLGLFCIKVLKRDKQYYIDQTRDHLLKYLSRAITSQKIKELETKTQTLDIFETIKKSIRLILDFTYEDIVKKRKEAVDDLFKFVNDSISLSEEKVNNTSFKNFWFNYHFKEELYYYFNAKYARSGYRINGKSFSLIDDTEKGTISNWNIFDKYAKVLNEQARFISECKMMRGSCKRIWRTLSAEDSKNEYVLKILYAFATFSLNNKFYYVEAEKTLIDGFEIYYRHIKDYKLLKWKFNQFTKLIILSTENEDFILYLIDIRYKIMLKIQRTYAASINTQIE